MSIKNKKENELQEKWNFVLFHKYEAKTKKVPTIPETWHLI